jgi:hypothetical protein
MGEKINAYRDLVGRPEGRRPLGRPKCRRDDDIKIDLKAVACDGGEWIQMTQGKDEWWTVVKTVMNLWVP